MDAVSILVSKPSIGAEVAVSVIRAELEVRCVRIRGLKRRELIESKRESPSQFLVLSRSRVHDRYLILSHS